MGTNPSGTSNLVAWPLRCLEPTQKALSGFTVLADR